MIYKNAYDLIKSPVMTEKSAIANKINKYIFKVSFMANKFLLKKAIKEIFDVNVLSINIMNYKGKRKRFKGFLGSRSNSKKALITLEKGQKIDLSTKTLKK